VPTEQDKQEPDSLAEYWPAVQAVHFVARATLNVPAMQVEHAVAPIAAEIFPAGQLTQTAAPALAANVP
jgi:hypothetical protein